MIRDLLKRTAPGAAMVFGGAVLVLAASGAANAAGQSSAPIHVAQAAAPAPSGSIVQIAPPRVADYWISVTRQPGGVLVFDGFVPNEAARSRFAALPQADISFLKLGGGAPATYQAGVDFGLSLLDHLAEGRFTLDASTFAASGTPENAADFRDVQALLDKDLPRGLALGEVEIRAPRAQSYDFTLTRRADGSHALSGVLPNPAAEQKLLELVGPDAVSMADFASGEPPDFLVDAEQAAAFLDWMAEGQVSFDGTSWTISGIPESEASRAAIDAEFARRNLAQSDWVLDLTEAPAAIDDVDAAAESPVATLPSDDPAPPEAEPTQPEAVPEETVASIDPRYSFAARRTTTGAVLVAGQVPAQATANYLASLAGADADTLVVAPGAPEGFAANAQAGMRALLQLRQGQLTLAQGKWTLRGEAASTADKTAIEATLADATVWTIAVSAPVSLAQCQSQVAELSAHNAILFRSGSSIIADGAESELDRFAAALGLCPAALVYVEGHTDSDGDDQLNLVLSVARAEAVVNALIARGIAPERLYAVGYGESQPVADNATAEGKRQNRRIVVSVQEGETP